MTDAWIQIIAANAEGRKVCNCGDAYYSPCGEGIDRQGRHRTDIDACDGGCSSNQIKAKHEIAAKFLAGTLVAAAPPKEPK